MLIERMNGIQLEIEKDYSITSALMFALRRNIIRVTIKDSKNRVFVNPLRTLELVAGEESFLLTLPEFQPLFSIRRSVKRELH